MKEILNFLTTSGRLKFTYRYSEVSKIPKESSAAHSWQLSLMVFLIADELNLDINIERALKIAIIHDIAEALTGDVDMILIKDKKVTKEEKYQLEIKAINKLQEFFSKSSKIKDLWQEYQENKTKEARFVKALDKIEALIFLSEIGYKFYDRPELIPMYADDFVKFFPELIPFLKITKLKLKEEFKRGNIPWKDKYNYSF